jgi:hypothetical protein
MIKKVLVVACTSALLVGLGGCATVFRGSSEEITFSTQPSKATIRLSTGQSCRTPCALEVSRKGEIFVTVTKDGYKEFQTALPASIDGGSLAGYTAFNIIMLPGVNDVVDYNTRANYSRKPNPLHIELIADSSSEDYKPIISEDVMKPVDAAYNEQANAEVKKADSQSKYQVQVEEVAESMMCEESISLQTATEESETWLLGCGNDDSLTVRCFDEDCYVKGMKKS